VRPVSLLELLPVLVRMRGAQPASQPQAQGPEPLEQREPQLAQRQRLELALPAVPPPPEQVPGAQLAELEPVLAWAQLACVPQPSPPHLSRCVPLRRQTLHPPLPANVA
jgi:hypothetical protein